MKKKFTFSILMSIIIFYTFTNNINNVSNANSWNSCGGCHTSSSNTLVDSIKLIHSTTGNLMTGFFPDSTYKIRMVAHNTAGTSSFSGFGFQLRAVNGSSASVGSYTGTLPTNTGSQGSGILTHNAVQSPTGGNYVIEVNWKAPASGTTTVNLQSVVNAVDMDGTSNGDNFSSSVKTVSYNILGLIGALNCSTGSTTGTLTSGAAASGVSFSIPYTGGNGGAHAGQVVSSTGVTGLTATLSAGNFATGAGNLVYTISGTPSASGTASFALNIGTKTCTYTISVALPVGTISTLDCSTGSTTGTLNATTAASGVSFSIPYTGGNGGTHSGQVVTSTGVSGLTATMAAGTFATGAGNAVFNVTGTPASTGTASFALNIGGQTCTYTITVNPVAATLTALNCASGKRTGTLTNGVAASGVSFKVPYTGGNGGAHAGQVVNSTGVTGLTATLVAGNVATGADSLLYTISGTPTSAGTANFALNIAGKTCTFTMPVVSPVGDVTLLDCSNGVRTGSLSVGVAASGISVSIPYTGGNTGTYSAQAITSTGVTGLTANLTAGILATGNGNLIYNITGTATSSGTASFAITIGSQSCTFTFPVDSGKVTALNCSSGTLSGTIVARVSSSGVSFTIPYTGGNGGGYTGQTVNSTTVTGLTATLSSGTLANGAGGLTYNITGTPSAVGNAVFALNIGGKTCNYTAVVIGGVITSLDCGTGTTTGTLMAGSAASGVSITVPYMGGNGGPHYGQSVTSTGVTGLTAKLDSGTFLVGSGTVTYNITGTPSAAGSADFSLSIGGQTCLFSITVSPPVGAITALNCTSGTLTGSLNLGTAASGVSFSIPYTGGNRGTYPAEADTSTGVLGLTASHSNGLFALGSGNLVYTISGTPTSAGNASFVLNIGGKTCTYIVNVKIQLGTIATLDCSTGTTTGTLNANSAASGVSFTIPYTGGNGGLYSNTNITSTGVTGLTASTVADTFENGAGTLKFTVSGTPTSSGVASFAINIGGQTCTYTLVVNLPLAAVTALNCGSGTKTGVLIKGDPATGVSFTIPYTGGNGGLYSAQTINSTGVTGLTASLSADTLKTGAGTLTYTVSGTPTGIGNASFSIVIGGKSCVFSMPVILPAAIVTNLYCDSGVITNAEPLMAGVPFNNVSYSIPYTGGNGGTYTTQTISSTGVTGLTANLTSGILNTGNGKISLSITGTASAQGLAYFPIVLGGKNCVFAIPVVPLLVGTITSLNCEVGTTNGILFEGLSANGKSFTIPYNGGNRGYHNGQTVSSRGITGLTATLAKGQFALGAGSVTYALSGTPSAEGMAYFDLYIGEQMCTYGIYVRTTVGAIASLNCGLGYTNNEFIVGRLNSGNTLTIPYSGGNGGNYPSQVVNSTEVTGLTATLPAGTLNIGDGVLVYTLSGTTTYSGYALFSLDVASKICIYPLKINSSTLSTNTPSIQELEVYKHENIIYFKNNYLDLNYQIVDINGKKLSVGSLKKTETSLDIKNLELPKGIIFIIVDTKEGSKTYKLSSY